MKHRLLYVFGLVVLGSLWLAAGPAAADSVGPYYANPSWDQTLAASTRFIVLSNMNGDAVLDRETGLVWEKSPSTSTLNWFSARYVCNELSKGNRFGWRLPTLQDLASLGDPSAAYPGPALPAGNPFQGVQPSSYWSANTQVDLTTNAWTVHFGFIFIPPSLRIIGPVPSPKSSNALVWCVRGGQGVDLQ